MPLLRANLKCPVCSRTVCYVSHLWRQDASARFEYYHDAPVPPCAADYTKVQAERRLEIEEIHFEAT